MNPGMRFLFLAAVTMFGAGLAQAKIGDDVTKLHDTYGKTGKATGSAMIFQHNGYSICVYFDGDYSAMEVFTRDGSEKGKTDITDKDILDILTMEGDGQGWAQVTSKSGKLTWLRGDKKVIARLSTGETDADKVFVVMVNQK